MNNSEQIDLLKQTLQNLPTIEERLRTWHGVIKAIDKEERETIETYIKILENGESVFILDMNYENTKTFVETYRQLFLSLLERFEIPIGIIKEKISELSHTDFKLKMQQFRKSEELRCTKKAEDLAQDYFNDYRTQFNKWDYMRNASSMVTGFLFQPSIYPTKDAEERAIFHKAFEGFNPMSYVIVFERKLKELFA